MPLPPTTAAALPPRIPVALPRRRRRMPETIIVPPPPRARRSENGERILTVAPVFIGEEQRPMIRMRGAWLRRLGFAIGARIVVSEERGRIVLTIEREESRG